MKRLLPLLLLAHGWVALASTVRFAEPQQIPLNTATAQVSLALGDFNGDGRRDFAVGFADGPTQVRSNQSIGSPGPRVAAVETSSLRVESGGGDVVLGDVNGDGVDDWCSINPSTRQVVTFSGGAATADPPARTLTRTPQEIQLADFDGDSRLDFLVGYASTPASVLRGNGNSATGAPINTAVDGPVLAIADMDGDGALDIVSGGGTSPRLSVSRGIGALTFAAPQLLVELPGGTGSFIEGLAVRSVKAGELPSIAAIVRDPGAAKRLLYVIRPGDLAVPTPMYVTAGPLQAVFARMRHVEVQDIVLADTDLHQVIVLRASAGENTPALAQLDVPSHLISVLVAGDVSGDGLADVVIASKTGSALVVFVNTTPPPRRRAVRP